MTNLKHTLLAATIIAGAAASPALAQTTTQTSGAFTATQINQIQAPGLPVSVQTVNGSNVNYDGDTSLHGAGATSIQNILVRAFNCLGTPNKLGNGQPGAAGSAATGSLGAKSPGVYSGTPSMTCNNASAAVGATGTSTYEVQPQAVTGYGFSGKYVGTGSGFGRKMWYWFGDVFDSGSSSHAVTGVANPFNSVNSDNRWSHIQYAFSDAPIAQSDLNAYNTTGNAVSYAGPAVQFPLFVLPVAIVYDATYGKNANGVAMVFNVQGKATLSTGASVAGLQLNAPAYCGIFNGTITNWNDPALQALNKKIPLGDATNDDVSITKSKTGTITSEGRWFKDGVPIRLVGRLDNSGTTDVFTRHLAAVCSNPSIYPGTNKYLNHAESLPYNASTNGGVNYTTVRADSNYAPATASTKFAGTTNTVTGEYFDGSKLTEVAGSTTVADPVAGSYNGTGLFIVANGGGNLAKAITFAPDLVEADGVTLNGKIGYISPDSVAPSLDASAGLSAALLGVGSGPTATAYVYPSFKNGLAAFGSVLPPESDATGKYTPGTDTRTVNQPGSGTGNATRTNPLAWTDVLYVSNTNQTSLAAPTSGYPITGTTQFFGYTCYATAGNRQAIAELLGSALAQVKVDQTGAKIAPGFLNGVTPATPGIFDQSNIAILPVAWQMAIANTFLSSTSDVNTKLATPLFITSGLVNVAPKGVITTPAVKATKTTPAVPAVVTYTLTQPAANTAACGSLQGA